MFNSGEGRHGRMCLTAAKEDMAACVRAETRRERSEAAVACRSGAGTFRAFAAARRRTNSAASAPQRPPTCKPRTVRWHLFGLKEYRVDPLFAHTGIIECRPLKSALPAPGLAAAVERSDESGVDSRLGTPPDGEPGRDDFEPGLVQPVE